MLLQRDEKAVFCRWLEMTITTSEGIIGQMERIGVPELLLKKERTEQAACRIVLKMIQSGEDEVIG